MTEVTRRARVLVVDDSRFHRELAGQVLEDLAQVVPCADAEAALRELARAPADVVVTDLSMPGLSGLELLERIQREHAGTDVVLLTAHASVESVVQALRVGATDYLQKPHLEEELPRVVERTLARRALVAENLRLRDERAILEACKALASCLEPEDVFAVGLDLVLRATHRERGFALYHRRALPSSAGLQCRGLDEGQEMGLRERLCRGKPVDLSAIEGPMEMDRGPLVEAAREVGVEAARLLVLPARGGAAEEGLFAVPSGTAFSEEARGLAELVRGHAAVALRNAERYRRARDRAFLDDVTEIYNARYLLEAMEREIRRAERYGMELSVLFLDLDRFKLVNDRHGHLVGSQVLRQLSQLLGHCVRQVDTLARYGGDEFTILLVDTGEAQSLEVAERIRRTVESHAFETAGPEPLSLTCSIGVSAFPGHARGREGLLDAADKAMYRAKSNGRNRVCSASDLG